MRLIDADKLENIIKYAYDAFAGESPENVHKSIGATLNIVKEMSTIKDEPIKHGKWIKRFGNRYMFYIYDCSKCECPNPMKTKYCPNCGAKMDGGEENERTG